MPSAFAASDSSIVIRASGCPPLFVLLSRGRMLGIPCRRRDSPVAKHILADLLVRRSRQVVDEIEESRHHVARRVRAAQNSTRVAGSTVHPGRTTTVAMRSSSVKSLGTPNAAASSTSGCSFTTSSTSNAEMFSPRRRMLSARRPMKWWKSSASRRSRSPVWNHRFRLARNVASGRSR